ncbi:hypothetical protein BJ508DRAFT_334415 [Ascobolus immersus RN42]|uniref:Uncharacterized protein n=1 Tax=Ascobolus immersus RN42 TaxID=1160509 RepID=A0A3N4HG55_ASCIM|nr:hypothetical protein BJ508DRAFT_334415 [Ascobolus immersus RN42]
MALLQSRSRSYSSRPNFTMEPPPEPETPRSWGRALLGPALVCHFLEGRSEGWTLWEYFTTLPWYIRYPIQFWEGERVWKGEEDEEAGTMGGGKTEFAGERWE